MALTEIPKELSSTPSIVDGGNATAITISSAELVTVANGLTLTDGNVVVAAGHGIDFSAQTATSASGASTTAELLNSYEEGTWTPTITGDTGSTSGQSYGAVTGHYVKIGRLVYLGFDFALTAAGSIGGTYATLNSLPFPVVTSNLGGGSVGYYINISNATGPLTFYVAASQAYIMKGGSTYVVKGDITNSTRILGFLSYRTST